MEKKVSTRKMTDEELFNKLFISDEVLEVITHTSDSEFKKFCQEVPILFRWGMNWQGLSVLE